MPPPSTRRTTTSKASSTKAPPTQVLIFDLGQSETKFGLHTSEQPTIIPTVVSFDLPIPKDKKPKFHVGKEALKNYKTNRAKQQNAASTGNSSTRGPPRNKKPTSTDPKTVLRYPYQNGMVIDWDQMEAVLQYGYDSVQDQLTEQGHTHTADRCPVLVTCDPLSPMIHRQGICELFIEYFNCEKLFMEAPGVLAMRNGSNGDDVMMMNGIAVSCGASFTSLVPVLNNKAMYTSTTHFPVAGQVLSGHILDMIKTAGYELSVNDAHRVAQHVKKNMAYTTLDLNSEFIGLTQNPEEFVQELELPNGESLEIGGEAFKLPEALFNPQTIGIFDDSSLQKSIYDVAQKFKPEDREKLYSNIVVSGGTTLLPGFIDRLQQELTQYLSMTNDSQFAKTAHVKYSSGGTEAEEESTASVWQGGKQWVSDELAGKTEIDWITRQEYLEEGSGRIVLKKCF